LILKIENKLYPQIKIALDLKYRKSHNLRRIDQDKFGDMVIEPHNIVTNSTTGAQGKTESVNIFCSPWLR
jgi:hypothetical protein